MKLTAAGITAICTATCIVGTSLSASACSLTKDQLLEKYACLFDIANVAGIDGEMRCASERCGADYAPQSGIVIGTGCENGFSYEILSDNTVRITGAVYSEFPDDCTVLQIPEKVDGLPVCSIGYGAFAGAGSYLPNLEEISVPDCVEVISERAFANAFGTSDAGNFRVNIPESVRLIGYQAYMETAPAVVNSQQTDRIIILPESLEYISSQAFDSAVSSHTVGSRVNGAIEVRMPQSLVMMSDCVFRSDQIFGQSRYIFGARMRNTYLEDIPAEDLPLVKSFYGRGFYNDEANVFSMRDVLAEDDETAEFIIGYESLYDQTDGFEAPISIIRGEAAKHNPGLLAGQESKNFPVLPAESVKGDISGNGVLDMSDAVLFSRCLAEDLNAIDESAALDNADMNCDGFVTGTDYAMLLRMLDHAV